MVSRNYSHTENREQERARTLEAILALTKMAVSMTMKTHNNHTTPNHQRSHSGSLEHKRRGMFDDRRLGHDQCLEGSSHHAAAIDWIQFGI